ncbi:hypothetical protein O7626_00335 [Micromonospora sp. WMMD1102]|uniref:hypothetical protein n=1 Tax=Micromonospora sp. WMMD1102 TaxID=3016105 RepID=UPI0024158BB8|nr:hypothetical protein [Micromonospora sp. WMMD1102]MDG4784393.1 hypothetical protein [Micromonospora sp. WMMD1102]
MSVNISAAFAKADRPRNGLVAIADKLVNEDLQQAEYWGVVRIKPNFFQVSAETGERTPTVKLPHIEVVLDNADIEAVRAILARRYKDRTGLEDTEPDALFDVTEDGRVVPEAGAEELLAERAEAHAAQDGQP